MTPIYFLRLSKVCSILQHGLVWRIYEKCYLMLSNSLFWHFLLFFVIKFVFLSFSFLVFDKVSNFRNRILTNQKYELVVSSCQWTCMYEKGSRPWILGPTFMVLGHTYEIDLGYPVPPKVPDLRVTFRICRRLCIMISKRLLLQRILYKYTVAVKKI